MTDEQTTCSACGARILVLTAQERGGLCAPCSNGTRARIEEGKRYYAEQKAYRLSPEWLFWKRLVLDAASFPAWPRPHQCYYAVNCLSGEVYNGGFEQYFSNSAGDHYESAIEGLEAMGAHASLALLQKAKMLIYGAEPVPRVDRSTTDDPDALAALDVLDQAFWGDPDDLNAKMRAFAREQGLFPVA